MPKRENFSQKRTAILKALQKTTSHPTADWIYGQLKPDHPNLSLGTVYRNLKKFCEDGTAVSVGVINGQEHFDGCVRPHAHFVCAKCGAVMDVWEELVGGEELQKLSDSTGWEVTGVSVLFQGVCADCREKGPGEDPELKN